MVDDDPALEYTFTDPGAPVTWAITFRSERIAQIRRLEWEDPIGTTADGRAEAVDVAISLDGPAGPWRDVGRWDLDRAPDGSVPPYMLPEGTLGTSIRLRTVPPARPDSGQRELPAAVRVIERATDDEYRSVIAEWGAASPVGPYELLTAPGLALPPAGPDGDDTPETATVLRAGEPAVGRVSADIDVDWYAISVPEGDNSLTLEASGRPVLGVALSLFDADGLRVPMLLGPGERPGSVTYRAEVDPGRRLPRRGPPAALVDRVRLRHERQRRAIPRGCLPRAARVQR